jgi:hypothetical protein
MLQKAWNLMDVMRGELVPLLVDHPVSISSPWKVERPILLVLPVETFDRQAVFWVHAFGMGQLSVPIYFLWVELLSERRFAPAVLA